MRTYAIFVQSPLSGNTVQIDCFLTPGPQPTQHLVHVSDHDEIIGHIIRTGSRQSPFLPVAYEVEEVSLPSMYWMLDAIAEIVQYLADKEDPRLDLAWRDVAA